ncbi:MAG: 3-phosphoshikimate 1-carboxyvinyltransferase [Methylobacteriaceae bacterium]|jgi:3-phosphoshikimate 1-carboxyvinyltransferase|nr:3-phosphoshikimate 1-carboxyvinyltransferase [Methylobacteriaceae bacterium]
MYFVSSRHALNGVAVVPGSKSHTIRAVVIATLAEGTSRIMNPLNSEDCLSAARACRLFGARIDTDGAGWTVQGAGGTLATPDDIVDCGNSGTALYFVTAMACMADGWSVLSGDHQLRRRPILPLLEALRGMGGQAFTTRGGAAAPAVVRGPLRGSTVRFSGKLSQYVSAILITAPYLSGSTRIELETPLERPYLDMTVEWMRSQGVSVRFDETGYHWFEVPGGQRYAPVNRSIPSDWEGVAFPLGAAVLTDSTLTIEQLDFAGTQGDAAIVDAFQAMGADIVVDTAASSLSVRGGKPLHGITLDCSDMPDAVPMLATLACFAEGDTTLTNLESVRLKETDRVARMSEELAKLGARCSETPTTLTIHGTGGRGMTGAVVNSHDDHRIAMALTVAGLALDGETMVSGGECCAVSFPDFFEVMNGIGAHLEKRPE